MFTVKPFSAEQVVVAVTFWTCILNMLSSFPDRDTMSTEVLHGFPWSFSVNSAIVPHLGADHGCRAV
jgi:hypothetical protein